MLSFQSFLLDSRPLTLCHVTYYMTIIISLFIIKEKEKKLKLKIKLRKIDDKKKKVVQV